MCLHVVERGDLLHRFEPRVRCRILTVINYTAKKPDPCGPYPIPHISLGSSNYVSCTQCICQICSSRPQLASKSKSQSQPKTLKLTVTLQPQNLQLNSTPNPQSINLAP